MYIYIYSNHRAPTGALQAPYSAPMGTLSAPYRALYRAVAVTAHIEIS